MLKLKKESHRHCESCGKKITSKYDLVKVTKEEYRDTTYYDSPATLTEKTVSWYCKACGK